MILVELGNPNTPQHLNGSVNRPRKWLRLIVENIDQFIFGGFINEILHNIENHPAPGNYYNFFIWDNLRTHKTPYITNIIENRETLNVFSLVDNPPHVPKIATIEFIFCELAAELS